jgi:putative transposase
MARPKDLNLAHAWRQRLHRQLSSGLTIPEFCAREGVSCSSFRAWKRRLTVSSLSAPPEPLLFVPLHLDAHPAPEPSAAGRGVEIELPHRVRIRFEAPPEPEWLGRLVTALAGLTRQEATS